MRVPSRGLRPIYTSLSQFSKNLEIQRDYDHTSERLICIVGFFLTCPAFGSVNRGVKLPHNQDGVPVPEKAKNS